VADDPLALEMAISELRRSVDVGIARIEGQLALLIQRAEQTDRRADQQAQAIDDLDDRVAKVERDAVTHVDLDKRAQRIIAILGVIVSVAAVILGGAITAMLR